MELAEVSKIIEELKGRFDAPFSSHDKSTIERLYYEVTGKTFKPTSCQQCYHDALVEIIYYLKKNGQMAEKSNFRLKAGAIIQSPVFDGGKIYVNGNLTDEVAMRYLAKFPGQVVLFQKLPEGYKVGDLPKPEKPTLEEAQELLKKAEVSVKGATTKVENIRKNVQAAETTEKKAKDEKALEKAEKALEKARKNFDEVSALVEELTAEGEEQHEEE